MSRLLSLVAAVALLTACTNDSTKEGPSEPNPGVFPEFPKIPAVERQVLEVPDDAVAIVNVTVVPMTDDTLLLDHIVVVAGDRIIHVRDAAQVTLPEGVQTIDGAGKFLMPGLVDMHVHTWFVDEGTLFVANGVTTVRNMFGDPVHLQWRELFADGTILGPTLITSGPIVDGANPYWPGSDIVTDAASAAQVVSAQQQAGYDFIKVYSRLTEPAWRAILDESEARGMAALGHIPEAVDYRDALDSTHHDNQHMERFGDAARGQSLPTAWAEWPNALAQIEPTAIAQLAGETAAAGMWNTPTIVVHRKIVPGIDDRPEMRYVNPILVANWESSYSTLPPDFFSAYAAYSDAIADWTRALYDAGAPLLAGSDCTNAWVIAGWSLHEELQFLVDAGLTPYDALRAATSDAATALGQADEFGTVEAGKRADLILVDDDPTADVANAAVQSGVFLRGKWHTADDLQAALEAIATRYDAMN